MSIRQEIRLKVPQPLVASLAQDRAQISLPEGPVADFGIVRVSTIALRNVTEIVARARDAGGDRLLVLYERASQDARDALRAADVSYIGGDGRVFVRAPGILVDQSEAKPSQAVGAWRSMADDDAARNPFAKRASRVARWLLLHPDEPFSLGRLADDVDLNAAAVSRIVRALEDAGHVTEDKSVSDGRRKQVQVRSPLGLLEAWLPLWQNRRITQRRWDIGAGDADAAIALVAEALTALPKSWALGGLSGAAEIERVVEPAELLVWTTPDGLSALEEFLMPMPGRGGRAMVRVAVAPDPWTLGLAHERKRRPVSDFVQLWLDCASSGERALEAADAVAGAAGWT
jgi:hypothetical protein